MTPPSSAVPQKAGRSAWLSHLATLPEWLAAPGEVPPIEASAAAAATPDRAAVIEIHQGGAVRQRLWRRDYLRQIVEYGLADDSMDASALLTLAAERARVHGYDAGKPSPPALPCSEEDAARGTVLLVSLFGVEKFGGAEHFLEQMAGLYKTMGYTPVIVGLRAERRGETGDRNGIRYVFVAATPEALFRLAWQERACLAHVVSGFGHEAVAALRFQQIRLVFGIHFWREMFEPPTAHLGYYPDCPDGYVPRRNMQLLLMDADAVYVNSPFVQSVVETTFGARLNVIPSLPAAADTNPAYPFSIPPPDERPIVLLPNSRWDKGLGLLLGVAARLPQISFVTIASQSPRQLAQALCTAAGLRNVTVLDRQDTLDALYRQARVVLTPSFQFVETFSRVVMEAQAQGVPVIGADRGNIPFLLKDSGTILPESADLWAEEIRRLFEDPEYWRARSEAALRNAASMGVHLQGNRLSRLISGLAAPMLVGVGSGVGNVVHTTPLIRRLSRHLGRRIDVVVAGDSPGALAVVANPDYVNHVFLLNDVPVRRQYDTVFLTNSFGELRPAFRARRVVRSREWDRFHAGHRLHETEFNLEAARQLLGVDYGAEDAQHAFVAGLRPRPGLSDLVGLHAGSKGGTWGAKRWPHFAELAARLMASGLRVASFGSAEEYVAGTIDRTGGSVEAMATAMQDCGAFVSNDSGVMNIANALHIPLLALFAPTEARTRGPLGIRSVSLALSKACAPCELAGRSGPFVQRRCHCIGEITVEAVEAAVRLMLDTQDTSVARAARRPEYAHKSP
ncbi:glycosyltransferase [Pararoseomonas indoligenes]|uniref:Glycosyltransferase n=1 Tax=Roseomonas indoligenes TaxID=2820811 RepID=A0A940N511_9PROT|nr:glycosyltransferase [Pararoseomonas indoligenes]MBP0495275.1 glycosyltransferase [Pararoseomonas indoligenes]